MSSERKFRNGEGVFLAPISWRKVGRLFDDWTVTYVREKGACKNSCGSEPARESGVSATFMPAGTPSSRAGSLPRVLGRAGADRLLYSGAWSRRNTRLSGFD